MLAVKTFRKMAAERAMVKLTPEQQQKFVADFPDAFLMESGAWGRSGCTRVLLAAADAETVGEAMTLAWQNVMAQKPGRSTKAKRPK